MEFYVDGMICGGCVCSVICVIQQIDLNVSVVVDLLIGLVKVQIIVLQEQVFVVLNDVGFLLCIV